MPSDSVRGNPEYQELLHHVGETLENGRARAVAAVNSAAVATYWEIGREIVEFEQAGNAKAEYGTELLKRLSMDLTNRYGKGFSHSNLVYTRKLHLA